MPLSIETLKKLVKNFKKLPPSKVHEPTFMQITGYPHLENVASNVLSFYLQPTNPHGFGTLLLEAFLSFFEQEQKIGNIAIHREDVTTEGKRLDLVIEADNFVLGIENKIYHAVVNPFAEYRRHLDAISKGRTAYGLVLGLNRSRSLPDAHGFQAITYQMLFERVQERFGGCLLSAKEPYITFFRDFVYTINDLTQGTTMDPAKIAYFHEYQPEIESLLTEVDTLRNDMKSKTKQLAELLDTSIFPKPIEPNFYQRPPELFALASYVIEVNAEVALQVNINLSPQGWRINLCHAKGEQLYRRTALEQWFGKYNIPVKPRSSSPWRLGYGSDTLDYQADLSLVQQEVQEFLRRISQALEAP